MSLIHTLIGMALCAALWWFGRIKEKRHVTGVVPLVPPFYIQFIALVGLFVFAAHLVVLVTGIDWKPPFQR
ncbi:hypothetical protein [Kordiimonas aestuarii]|uniref:hypothetical protein n=1 Tax=Kordiimonas aestuarii TaxID=1005925 RepID=UPI0021D386D5|nr:hypothetical protein [Kordiimonas aestuarii]